MKVTYNGVGGEVIKVSSVPVVDPVTGRVMYTRLEVTVRVDPPKEK